MAFTKSGLVIKILLAAGYKEVEGRSGKYRTFAKDDKFAFVGKAGALRVGPCASKSRSATHLIPQLAKKYLGDDGFSNLHAMLIVLIVWLGIILVPTAWKLAGF